MPGWKPILVAPFLAVSCWLAAYWVAAHRGAPEGDTNFIWMPLVITWWGIVWLVGACALCLIRVLLRRSAEFGPATVAAVAIAGNLIAVAVIYGNTWSARGGDGWPNELLAVTGLAVGGTLSVLPAAWIMRQMTRRPVA